MHSNKSINQKIKWLIVRKKIFLLYLSFAYGWLLANVMSEGLEEISFLFETSFAVAQWLVLRSCFGRISWWVLVSVWGWILASILIRLFALGDMISPFIPGAELEITSLSITVQLFWVSVIVRSVEWIIIGSCQWLLLRCYIEQAGWWIFASAIAGGIKGGLELSIRSLDGGALGAVGGAIGYGIVTGIAWIGLLYYNVKQNKLRHRGGRA